MRQASYRSIDYPKDHMFYSPFDVCHVCKQYVLLDQTKKECATEHDCRIETCPLEQFFAEGYDRVPFPERRFEPKA